MAHITTTHQGRRMFLFFCIFYIKQTALIHHHTSDLMAATHMIRNTLTFLGITFLVGTTFVGWDYPCWLGNKVPSMNQSKLPSKYPSMLPSILLDKYPSKLPSINPSKVPTINPSKFPRILPSKDPSDLIHIKPSKYTFCLLGLPLLVGTTFAGWDYLCWLGNKVPSMI